MPERPAPAPPDLGDPLLEVLERVRPAFDAIRRAFGIRAEDGEDLLQETLVLYCRKQSRIELPEAWLRTVFRNQCRRYLRRRRLEIATAQELAHTGLPRQRTRTASREILIHEVLTALGELSEKEQRLVRGRYFEEIEPQDLAQRLGVRPSSLKKMAARTRVKLRKLLRCE